MANGLTRHCIGGSESAFNAPTAALTDHVTEWREVVARTVPRDSARRLYCAHNPGSESTSFFAFGRHVSTTGGRSVSTYRRLSADKIEKITRILKI